MKRASDQGEAPTRTSSLTVVIPAYNAAATLPDVLTALASEVAPHDEIIVVDDGSTDATAAVASQLGAIVVSNERHRLAGGARNRGWARARGNAVAFLDADAVPSPGWRDAVERALGEFPGAIVGGARTFSARTRWGWVAHFQTETPYLPRGTPRRVRFLSSLCMVVPREVSLRWDETYGGEDILFCANALAAGLDLIFDPRIRARHAHTRETFHDLRRQQRRLAYALARCGRVQREGTRKRILSRVPFHYFVLLRLPVIYARLRHDRDLRAQFLRVLPHLVLAEWMLGISASRYVLRRPALSASDGPTFR